MISAITEALDRKPFRRFRIALRSGDSFTVTNRHMVALGKARMFIAMQSSDTAALVSYLHVAALEAISPARAKARRRRAG